jgi:hypothetical protein
MPSTSTALPIGYLNLPAVSGEFRLSADDRSDWWIIYAPRNLLAD